MELEIKKKKVAVDPAGNIMAFTYQSASTELEVEDYPEFYILEPIFTPQLVNRFKVADGIVVKKSDEEIKADQQYVTYQKDCIKKELTAEADPLYLQSVRGEVTTQEWLDKVAEIRARYPH